MTEAAHSPIDQAAAAGRRRGHRLHVLMLLLGVAVLSLLLIFSEPLEAMPLQALCGVASACSILLCAAVFPGSSRGVWSVPFSYVAVFWVFHFGLIFAYAIGAQLIEEEARWLHQWFFLRNTHAAIVLACSGLAACVTGVYLAGLIWGGPSEQAPPASDDPPLRAGLTVAGFWLLGLSVAAWVVIGLLSGGPGLLFGDYMTWLGATADTPTIWVYYGVGVGMTLMAIGSSHSLRRWGFAVFGAWALVAFPLGLRGEVLFPLTTALVVMARRKTPLPTGLVVVSTLFLLFAIAVVRDLRNEGISRANTSSIRANPLSALGEMGASLRPVVEVLNWRDRGDAYLYGGTYWAPIERALTAVLPVWERPPADQDERIMNVVVQRRVGPIGFSVLAEAHRNFGTYGVPAVMLLLGVLLGWLESWPATPARAAVLGVVFVELLFHVRNDFIAVPVHVVLALCLILFVRFAAHYRLGHAGPGAAALPTEAGAAPAAGWDPTAGASAAPRTGWGRRRAPRAPGSRGPAGRS